LLIHNPAMTTVAERMRPLIELLIGSETPLSIRFWDGSALGPATSPAIIRVRSPQALRRLLWSPNELGLGRAYVAGEIDIDGDVFAPFRLHRLLAAEDRPRGLAPRLRIGASLLRAAATTGALGRPLSPPPEEARLRGRLHSRERDAAAIAHHYDVSNDFYRLVLGETMTYSCAYFGADLPTGRGDRRRALDEAQTAKYDLICRKLGLRPGLRLLDVGCGWGGMVMHAAREYGVHAVGITLSQSQADGARQRVAKARLENQVEIRVQDYRECADGPFDAISSIGMFEHVGLLQMSEYCAALSRLLALGGRLLNHGICRPQGSGSLDQRSFAGRYVFPDAELHEVGIVSAKMQEAGLEIRDVESLREHYALTLSCWIANLEEDWQRALTLVTPGRARVWRLYMAGSAANFATGRLTVHQILGVKVAADGFSGMPLRRDGLLEGGGLHRRDELLCSDELLRGDRVPREAEEPAYRA
jgi:cyclopropane-fatty-acyl-phospholipid synthase